MNLLDHVLGIRLLIHRAFDGKFERLGIMNDGFVDMQLSEEDNQLRKRIKGIIYTNLPEQNGDHAKARDYTLKQCVFTLFNRLAAIKLMEQKELFPEVIKQRTENGGLSAAHQQWLEEHPESRSLERDGLLSFIEDKFKELAQDIPVYRADYPYSMFPTADEMNEIIRAFNQIEDDPDCQTIWKGDDILGWLYENFNAAEKVEFKNSGAKTEYDKVSLQSQVYTPSWVVKFLVDNTLGKLYLEMYPESQIDKPDINGNRKYSIANRPTRQMRTPQDLRTLRVIDPACGSGNFLLYAFMLLYDLYIDQMENFGKDYNRREIPALIIENNLFGVDLDERAVQLAQIGLLIKAREVGGRRARMPHHTNIVCSNFYLPPYEEVEREFGYDASWTAHLNSIARKIWTDLSEAYKFGTLVRVEEQLKTLASDNGQFTLFDDPKKMDDLFGERNRMKTQLHNLANMYGEQAANPYTLLKMNEAMTFLDVISNQYDVALANPPYTPSDKYGIELKAFVDGNYSAPVKARENLYTCFMLRLIELLKPDGCLGFICPQTFMFIDSFKGVRKHLLDTLSFNLFVQFGFGGIFKESVDPVFFTAQKSRNKGITTAFKYDHIFNNSKINTFFQDVEALVSDNTISKNTYLSNFDAFKELKSYPFLFWLSADFREKFKLDLMADFADVKQGIATGNNMKYCRYWWEVCGSSQKYYPYAKGGEFNRWSGNLWLHINFEPSSIQSIKEGGVLKNQNYYFREGITYSASGRGGYAFRYLPPNCLFDVGGSSIFLSETNISIYYLLSLLNSKLCFYIADSLNPTANIQVGDLRRMPIAFPDSKTEANIEYIAQECVRLSDIKRSSSLIEDNYSGSPITCKNDVQTVIKQFYDSENFISTVILLYESLLDSLVFDIYELSPDDRKVVLTKEGELFSDLPVSLEAKRAFLEKLNPEKDKLLFEFVDSITTTTEITAIHDYERLYQSSYSWEEFCDKNRLNPIEVWFQYSKITYLPSQRTQKLAFELITDVIRSVMSKDDDGVIPLTTNAGETNLAPRIEAEMVERGYKPAQIAQVFSLLGGSNLERYLQERFFQQLSDNLNLFMYLPKTPFIWHITSGQHHALDIFVSIYNWSRDTLLRIKSVYAANREAALNDRLLVLLQGDATQKAEAVEVRSQIKELSDFCGKIDELLALGYDPKLDDGVGKNIAPLQKIGLINYEVLNKKQLDKLLNADW